MTAPMVVDGAINGELFLEYVKQILMPTLRKGDIVVLDNFEFSQGCGCEGGDRVGGSDGGLSPPIQS